MKRKSNSAYVSKLIIDRIKRDKFLEKLIGEMDLKIPFEFQHGKRNTCKNNNGPQDDQPPG